ncbi:MAG TPA: carboxymuconolactone decarboxylase family protein [Candidatus Angelobacter sp.]|nr:carboxymuconolactone decarboxylase family protein [Candidatus Angelobacter sp.]
MARLKALSEENASSEVRAVYDRVKARFGMLVEPVSVTAAHPEIFDAFIAYEVSLRSATRVSAKLKELAYLKVATIVGCPFCIDLGSALAKNVGITERQMQSLSSYADSPEFSQPEKTTLDFATAMTLNPVNVTDDLFSQLQECFEPAQIIEITAAIAWENYRSRFNHALGMKAHGFSEGSYCVPPERKQV